MQAAVTAAQPGWDIIVHPGTYSENVRVQVSGTAEDPIRIRGFTPAVSYAEGAWTLASDAMRSKIIGPSTLIGSYGLSFSEASYWIVDGLDVSGAREAAIGAIGDSSPLYLCSNIEITRCYAHGSIEDGIKIAYAEGVDIHHNIITGGNDQDIDLYAALNSGISANLVGPGSSGAIAAGIVIKGGSAGVLIDGNDVTSPNYGIKVGDGAGVPMYPGNEAANAWRVSVTNNVSRSASPLAFVGADDCGDDGGNTLTRTPIDNGTSTLVTVKKSNATTDNSGNPLYPAIASTGIRVDPAHLARTSLEAGSSFA